MVLKVPQVNVALREKMGIQALLVTQVLSALKDQQENQVQLVNPEYLDYQECQGNPEFLAIAVKKVRLVHQGHPEKMVHLVGKVYQDFQVNEE